MWKWAINMLDRISAVIGALVFSQAPMFMQQYQQQLEGHVAELRIQIEAMRQVALQSGKDLSQFILKFTSSPDLDFSRQGDLMHKMTDRYQDFLQNSLALEQSTAMTRPFVFLSHLNQDIASSTFKTFNLGLEFSIEGLIYALLGIFFGYSFFAGLKKIFRLIFGLCLSKKNNAA